MKDPQIKIKQTDLLTIIISSKSNFRLSKNDDSWITQKRSL
jgi:hypothetical protein